MALPNATVDYEGYASGAAIPGQKVSADRIVAVADPRLRGTRAARCMVLAGDLYADGCRAEITANGGEVPGQDGWYGMSFFFPDGSDAWGRGDPRWESGPMWGIVWQLHHQQSTGSPPFGILADRGWSSTAPHRLYLDVRGGGSYADAIGSGGKTQNLLTLINPLPLGRWISVILQVAWSATTTGVVRAWTKVDGVDTDFVQRVDRTGIKTIFTDTNASSYWKMGIYASKNDSSVAKRVVYNQGFCRRASYADVAAWLGSGGGSTPTPPTPVLPLPPDVDRFGTDDGGQMLAAATPDRNRGSRYTLTTARSIPGMRVLMDGAGVATSGTCTVRGVIYTADGVLVATTQEGAVVAGQAATWVNLPFTSPPNLPAGDYRQHAITGGDDVARYGAGNAAGDPLEWAIDTYSDGPAAPWVGTVDTGKRVAIYARTAPPTGANLRGVAGAAVAVRARLAMGGGADTTVPMSDVQWRIRPELLTPENLAAARSLATGGVRVQWPQEATRISTGERLTVRPDGAYIIAPNPG